MTQLADTTQEYDPTANPLRPHTPTLDSVIRQAIRGNDLDLRVCAPCKVVAVRNNYRVDLQPLQQAKFYSEPGPTTLPIIANAPVCQPGGVNWQVKYPIDVGDVGLAVYADRALEAFMASSGEPSDPQYARTHDLLDAIYVPGMAVDSMAQQRNDTTDDLVIRNGTSEVRLERDGQFRIYSGAPNNLELVDLIGQLAAHCEAVVGLLQQAMTQTMLGPMPFYAATQTSLIQAKTTVGLIKQSLGKMKG
jgi:hypothetical protein